MSSAKQFSQSVLEAGRGALMSKMDMRDAYKQVPARPEDYRLQGMAWLGSYFIDTQQIFGASTAVSNFDDVGETVLQVTLNKSSITRNLVHRTLDDVACVAPASESWCENFTNAYKATCQDLNIRLAEDCPRKEKAFSNSTSGTVLGIQFDTQKLQWKLADKKIDDILYDIHEFQSSGSVSLEQTEKLAGRLTHFAQMSPFLSGLKRPLNILLAEFKEDYDILLRVGDTLKRDLDIWANAILHSKNWSPISQE
jgi:hypothetical protein